MQLQDASGPSFDPDDALTLVFGAIVVGGNRQRRHAPAWYNAVAVAAAAAAAATEYVRTLMLICHFLQALPIVKRSGFNSSPVPIIVSWGQTGDLF